MVKKYESANAIPFRVIEGRQVLKVKLLITKIGLFSSKIIHNMVRLDAATFLHISYMISQGLYE